MLKREWAEVKVYHIYPNVRKVSYLILNPNVLQKMELKEAHPFIFFFNVTIFIM